MVVGSTFLIICLLAVELKSHGEQLQSLKKLGASNGSDSSCFPVPRTPVEKQRTIGAANGTESMYTAGVFPVRTISVGKLRLSKGCRTFIGMKYLERVHLRPLDKGQGKLLREIGSLSRNEFLQAANEHPAETTASKKSELSGKSGNFHRVWAFLEKLQLTREIGTFNGKSTFQNKPQVLRKTGTFNSRINHTEIPQLPKENSILDGEMTSGKNVEMLREIGLLNGRKTSRKKQRPSRSIGTGNGKTTLGKDFQTPRKIGTFNGKNTVKEIIPSRKYQILDGITTPVEKLQALRTSGILLGTVLPAEQLQLERRKAATLNWLKSLHSVKMYSQKLTRQKRLRQLKKNGCINERESLFTTGVYPAEVTARERIQDSSEVGTFNGIKSFQTVKRRHSDKTTREQTLRLVGQLVNRYGNESLSAVGMYLAQRMGPALRDDLMEGLQSPNDRKNSNPKSDLHSQIQGSILTWVSIVADDSHLKGETFLTKDQGVWTESSSKLTQDLEWLQHNSQRQSYAKSARPQIEIWYPKNYSNGTEVIGDGGGNSRGARLRKSWPRRSADTSLTISPLISSRDSLSARRRARQIGNKTPEQNAGTNEPLAANRGPEMTDDLSAAVELASSTALAPKQSDNAGRLAPQTETDGAQEEVVRDVESNDETELSDSDPEAHAEEATKKLAARHDQAQDIFGRTQEWEDLVDLPDSDLETYQPTTATATATDSAQSGPHASWPGVSKTRVPERNRHRLPSHESITGGQSAHISEMPFLAILKVYKDHGPIYCTSSIISEKWVLSAAHCIGKITDPKRVEVIAGRTSIRQPERGGVSQKRRARRMVLHPTWEVLRNPGNGDLALIETESSFRLDNVYVSSIKLRGEPWFEASYKSNCTAAGWGRRRFYERTLGALQLVSVAAQHGPESCPCVSSKKKERVVCLEKTPGRGICKGDSGGPLICDEELVGVAHVLYPTPQFCAKALAGEPECGVEGWIDIYMYTCPYLDWIRSYVGERVPPQPPVCSFNLAPSLFPSSRHQRLLLSVTLTLSFIRLLASSL